MQTYWVYILANKINTVFYIGVTNNLRRRIYEHKQKLIEGFTKRYCVDKLVYFEEFTNPDDAIAAEKKLKGWNRWKKVQLIQSKNKAWNELFTD